MSAATLAQIVQDAAARIAEAGIPADDARRDAGLLARHVLGWDEAGWLVGKTSQPPDEFPSAFKSLLDRRVRREPIAYILGEREFYGRMFKVGPAVLIPRPETELLVETSLEAMRRRAMSSSARVVDIGTGSGCLAVTLACERPALQIAATDVSAAALEIARENASRYLPADRIAFACGDLFAGLDGAFDLIVSNPPYVPETDRASLATDVASFEPATALFGGEDGLEVIRRLLPAASERLTPDGLLVMEIGFGQSAEIADLVHATRGLRVLTISPDLQGIPRVVVVERAATGAVR